MLPAVSSAVGQQTGAIVTPSPRNLSAAVTRAVAYLERNCDQNGRFAYSVDRHSGRASRSYNIVRHAGVIYSLEMTNRFRPDDGAQRTIVRAGGYLWSNYVGADANSDVLAVWASPKPNNFEAELGAAGLRKQFASDRRGKQRCFRQI
jgi:hypothetical protein